MPKKKQPIPQGQGKHYIYVARDKSQIENQCTYLMSYKKMDAIFQGHGSCKDDIFTEVFFNGYGNDDLSGF